MNRPIARLVVTALIFLFIGIAGAAAVMAYFPDPGSPPSIFDDFKWDSTANGFWHVNAIGGSATVANSVLTISGHSVELDRRMQTDPNATVVIAKVRGFHFHKFGLGIGVYHSGTVGLEFDDDGVKCGRGSDYGWKVDFMKSWTIPPAGKWFYLEVLVKNPYPKTEDLQRAEKLFETKKVALNPVTVTCSMYDDHGKLLSRITPSNPPANSHYVSFDEAFMRTWDSNNDYQIDWIYSGPTSGAPIAARFAF